MFGEEFKLLVASADCAGALDVTDDLQHLLDGDELTGLHCFHHLRDRVAASIESINRLSWTMKKPPIIKIVFFLSSLDCLEQ
ncbi:vacuolar protein sorting-associated protein 54 chloroplastic-like isoform X4 [Prunus yedoensis var. nudiflora]|uniref:Vacuolar protein sorting-associated protein 54 chloroplastic-like isoform X4 n=1 Tax=Prunus yedoensis var. nudiflora TaxID=2094558 RepID=A0A314Y5U1_PRUYE|nr:vacuolar protein sorting-associated protein 54 chloroplastic-like isoform X4 [Prunus yedoensis var. nudiflora]